MAFAPEYFGVKSAFAYASEASMFRLRCEHEGRETKKPGGGFRAAAGKVREETSGAPCRLTDTLGDQAQRMGGLDQMFLIKDHQAAISDAGANDAPATAGTPAPIVSKYSSAFVTRRYRLVA